ALATLARYQRRIEALATTDPLTGLATRHGYRLLADQMEKELRRTPQRVSVLMADVDRFKSVNDTRGHAAGDATLAAVGRALRAELRASDIRVRWGGDEFLVVLRGCDLVRAQDLAERIRRAAAAAAGPTAGVTLSVGVAERDPLEPLEATVARADHALMDATRAGRDRVAVAAPPNTPARPPAG
ncbi:MAG: GGDEF domain-containing protein, partial [Tagaea sp.]